MSPTVRLKHPFYLAAVCSGFLLALRRNRGALLGVAESLALLALVWFALSGAIYLGLVLAATVFALSVVTIPMVVERHVDAATAMRMSLRVTARDFYRLCWYGLP